MLSILSLIIVVTLSILITRIATVALTHTGLSRESARFQARSAFTGVGFTTSESEKVVNHPVRRRVLLLLMLLGNAGIITAVSSLMLTFIGPAGSTSLTLKIFILVGGLVVLWGIASSRWVDRHLSRIISRALKRGFALDIKDYASLLHLSDDYRVTELEVEEKDWIANRKLSELGLRDEGVTVLGIHRRDGKYIGAPHGPTKVVPEDTLILYGRAGVLEDLDRRRRDWSGDWEHDRIVEEQSKMAEEQDAADADTSTKGQQTERQ